MRTPRRPLRHPRPPKARSATPGSATPAARSATPAARPPSPAARSPSRPRSAHPRPLRQSPDISDRSTPRARQPERGDLSLLQGKLSPDSLLFAKFWRRKLGEVELIFNSRAGDPRGVARPRSAPAALNRPPATGWPRPAGPEPARPNPNRHARTGTPETAGAYRQPYTTDADRRPRTGRPRPADPVPAGPDRQPRTGSPPAGPAPVPYRPAGPGGRGCLGCVASEYAGTSLTEPVRAHGHGRQVRRQLTGR